MNTFTILRSLIGITILASMSAQADVVSERLQEYSRQGAGDFSPQRGEALWQKKFPASDGQQRSCTTCHMENLRESGTHAVTRKTIEPMAPSVNPQRLGDARFVEKWFLRNCKWTLGRECTPQEKGDVLMFITSR